MLNLLLGTIPLACAIPAALAIGRRLRAQGPLESLIAWIWILAAMGTLLGIAGVARPGPILAISAILAVFGCLGVLRWTRGGRRFRMNRSRVAFATTGTALVLAPTAWFALSLPITNFDSLAYHLPMLAEWTRAGSLTPVDWIGVQRCYPMTLIAMSIPSTVLAPQDLFASIVAFVAFPLWGLAIHRLARELGSKREHAVVGAVLAMSLPVVVRSATSIQPDLMLAGLFVTALAAATSLARRPSLAAFAVLGCTLSLLPGLKPSGWVYGLIALGYLVVRIPRSRWRSPLAPAVSRRFSVSIGALFALFALIWPLRAFIDCGFDLGLGPVSGSHDPATEWSARDLFRTTIVGAFRPLEAADWAMAWSLARTSLGIPFILVIAFVALRSPSHCRVPEPLRGSLDRRRLAVGTVLLMTLIAYVTTPFSADNGFQGWRLSQWSNVSVRYGLPFLGSLVAVIAAMARCIPKSNWLLGVMALASALFSLDAELSLAPLDTLASLGLALAAGAAVFPLARLTVAPSFGLGTCAIVCLLLLSVAAPRRDELRDVAYGSFFAEVADVAASGATIASYGIDRPYPLYGRGFEHAVVSKGRPRRDRRLWQTDRARWSAEAKTWLRSLEGSGVRYVVVRTRDPRPDLDARSSAMARILREDSNWTLRLDSGDASSLQLFESSSRPEP